MLDARPRRRSLAVALVLAVLAVGVVGCADGDQPDAVTWRNITLDLPDGWYLLEQEETRLSIANQDLRRVGEGEPLDGPAVGMFLTFEPDTLPDDWRRYVEEQDATLESDTSLRLDGDVPATQLVFSYTTGGIPTREMVVVIPSRAVVVLAQPVPFPGDTDAPEVFLDHVDTFVEVLEGAQLGAPVLE